MMRTLLARLLLVLLLSLIASTSNAFKSPLAVRGGATKFEANLPVPVVNYQNVKILELFGLEFRFYYFCATDPHETAKFKRIRTPGNKFLELDFNLLRFAGPDEIQYNLDCKLEIVKKQKKRGFIKRLLGID